MLKQQNFLTAIAQNLHQSAPQTYDSATLIYQFDKDDEIYSFSAWFVIDGKNTAPHNFSQLRDHLVPIIQKLRSEMKNEGNEWYKFTLKIDQDRKVTTLFDYDEQSI